MIRAPLEIYANRSGTALAEKICGILSTARKEKIELKHVLVRPKIEQFACGEFKISLQDSVRGKDVFLIQCAIDKSDSSRTIQDNVWETLMTLDALRNCHSRHVTLVIPSLPYSRQDKRDGREPCSALLFAKMVAAAGAGGLITIDLHASQIKEYYEAVNVLPDTLYATNIFLEYIKSKYPLDQLTVVAPDEGAAKRARYYAGKIFGAENTNLIEERLAYTIKHRSAANTVGSVRIQGDVKDRIVLIPDDSVDTCSTMEAVVDAVYKEGGKFSIICATHPFLSTPATERLDRLYKEGKLKELITTDTVPHKTEFISRHPWFNQFSVAELLAKIIDTINKQEKISPLYL